MTDYGWFAARPSGTEEAYKIYCESFRGSEHREIGSEKKKLLKLLIMFLIVNNKLNNLVV